MSIVLTTPVSQVFDAIPEGHREVLMAAREMIFDVAANDPRVGDVEEALRWGEPAYLTQKGSTIRLAIEKTSGQPAMFFNCKSTLVETFRTQYGDALRYMKNRAVLLNADGNDAALKGCIAAALTYHHRR